MLPATRKGIYARNPPATAYLTPIRVTFEIVTPGSRADDAMNLWERFEDVIWPQEPIARKVWEEQLAAAGVRDVHLLQPALPASLEGLAPEMVVADGAIQLDLFKVY